MIEKITELLNNIGGSIIAHDTHRWMETDNFYEVQFELVLDGVEIYLITVYGQQELEDEWSGNERIVYSSDFLNLLNTSQLEDIFETLSDYINKNYTDDDYRYSKTHLKFQHFITN